MDSNPSDYQAIPETTSDLGTGSDGYQTDSWTIDMSIASPRQHGVTGVTKQRSLWIMPLTVGHPVPGKPHQLNYFISSIVLFLLLLSFSLSFKLACEGQHEQVTNKVDSCLVDFIHISYAAISIIIICKMLKSGTAIFVEISTSSVSDSNVVRRRIKENLYLISMWFFYPICVILDLVKVASDFELLFRPDACTDHHVCLEHVSSIVVHICRVFLLGMVCTFITWIHQTVVKRDYRPTLRVCFAVLLATLIDICVNCVYELYKNGLIEKPFSNTTEGITPNNSYLQIPNPTESDGVTTDIYNKSLRGMLYPCLIELLLISIKVLLQFFSSLTPSVTCKKRLLSPECSITRNSTSPFPRSNHRPDDASPNIDRDAASPNGGRELNTRLRRGYHLYCAIEPQSPSLRSPDAPVFREHLKTPIVFPISAFFAACLITSCLAKDHVPGQFAHIAHSIIKCLYYGISIGVIYLGFWCSRHAWQVRCGKCKLGATRRYITFSGLDLIVLLSTTGYFIWQFISIIAIFSYLTGDADNPLYRVNYKTIDSFTLLTYIFDLCVVSFKSLFIFYSIQVKWPILRKQRVDSCSCIKQNELDQRRSRFRQCVLFMASECLACWVMDSFIDNFDVFINTPNIQNAYFKHSKFFLGILAPFSIFFNFNAFFMFIRVYLQ